MARQRTRRLAAVWFADIVGFTSLSSRDEDAALALVDDLEVIAAAVVEANEGRVVKHMGDAVLAAFESVEMALRAAIALDSQFPSPGVSVLPATHQLRIGVHLGEVSENAAGDLHGDGVNMAARIQDAAEAGQIVVSESVYHQIRRRKVFEVQALGTVDLKGIEEPIQVFLLSAMRDGGKPHGPGTCPAHVRGRDTPQWEFLEHQADLYRSRALEEMLLCTRTARAVHGDVAEFWNHEGVALSDLGRYREALDCFERAIELNRGWVQPWCNKGRALRRLNRPEEAVLSYDKAIHFGPDEVIPYVNKGNCLLEDLNQLDEAAECFNKVLALTPKDDGSRDSFDAARSQLVRINQLRNLGSG